MLALIKIIGLSCCDRWYTEDGSGKAESQRRKCRFAGGQWVTRWRKDQDQDQDGEQLLGCTVRLSRFRSKRLVLIIGGTG